MEGSKSKEIWERVGQVLGNSRCKSPEVGRSQCLLDKRQSCDW
jgi:hypothetical protein